MFVTFVRIMKEIGYYDPWYFPRISMQLWKDCSSDWYFDHLVSIRCHQFSYFSSWSLKISSSCDINDSMRDNYEDEKIKSFRVATKANVLQCPLQLSYSGGKWPSRWFSSFISPPQIKVTKPKENNNQASCSCLVSNITQLCAEVLM